MASITSFTQLDTPSIVAQDFRALGRTSLLYNQMNPSEGSLVNRIQSVWTQIKETKFDSNESMQAAIASKLENIHPLVHQIYQSTEESKKSKLKANIEALTASENTAKEPGDQGLPAKASKEKSWAINDLSKLNELAKNSAEYAKGHFNNSSKLSQQVMNALNVRELKDSPTRQESEKKAILDTLIDCWEKLSMQELSKAEASTFVETRLANVPQTISEIYLEDLALAEDSPEEIKSRANSYLNDFKSIKKGAELTSTTVGDAGHPKIVNFRGQITGFMKFIKNQGEFQEHLVYEFLLQALPEDLGIKIPRAIMLHFPNTPSTSGAYADAQGNITKFDPKESSFFNKLLTAISTMTPRVNEIKDANIEQTASSKLQKLCATNPVAIFDRVVGSNLLDFFKKRYLDLPIESKKQLFAQLGMIALLDLILGNQDRLLSPDTMEEDPQNFLELPMPSNLGNLMIFEDSESRKTFVHAIDNGLGDGRIDSADPFEEDNAKYLTFLGHTFSKENYTALIAEKLLENFESALNEQGLATSLNDIQMLKKDHLLEAVQSGVSTMRLHLHEVIIPKWNSAESGPLKTNLSKDLIELVTSRLEKSTPS